MKRQSRILAGTALGLLMASAPFAAPALELNQQQSADMSYLMAQAEVPLTEEELLKKKKQLEEAAPPVEEPSAPEPQAEPEPAPEPKAEPQPESAPEPAIEETAPKPEVAPEPKVEEPAPAPEPKAEEPAPEAPKVPDAEQAVPEAPAATVPAEPVPEVPKAAEPVPEVKPAAPAAEQPAPAEAPAEIVPEGPADIPAAEPVPEAVTPAPDAAVPALPDATAPAQPEAAQPPAPDVPAVDQPVVPEGSTPAPEGQAPLLDSQKQSNGGRQRSQKPGEAPAETAAPAAPTDPAAPPPADDSAAQQDLKPVEIQPATAEEGKRLETRPDRANRERPKDAEVIREVGDRTIIQINNQIIVQSSDRDRLSHGSQDVYYEELPRGRTREVIVRADGTRVITVRDSYGDIIRRTRVMPDDREYVLYYVDEENYDRVRDWRDPGLDLPPMRLTIPADEYILDADSVDDEDRYYTFLNQPPVERVERIYSVDEVKRSARIRDKVRRVDMDTINFAFGSADVAEAEVAKLEGVAGAMEQLLTKNPAETFLIEGHTDAVGSDEANLALSDRRASAVAEALTNVFGIPPENLAPQGYGEQYLKVNTQARNQENRRVAIRRITALVSPVASAK